MPSKADVHGQTDSVDGATVEDVRHGEERAVRWK